MFSIFNYFSVFDMFGVTFSLNQRPQNNSSTYKSAFGGLVSMLILTLGLIYSSNLILKWFENSLIMKISSQAEEYDSTTFQGKFENKYFNSSFSIYMTNTNIDPFVESEIYIIPLLINITSVQIANVLYFHNSSDSSLSVILQDSLEANQYILVFVSCLGNEKFLSNGQQCANQEKLNDFFSTPGLELDIYIKTKTISVYTSEITSQETYISMYLQKSIIPEYTILLDYSYYELRHGQFFSQTTDFYLLSTAYNFFTAFCEPGFIEYNLEQYQLGSNNTISNVVANTYLSTNVNVNHVIAEYPAVSEVLANVGSTIQTMLLIKYLLLYFNKFRMTSEFKNFCRDLYFPEIKNITTHKNEKKQYIYHEKYRLDPRNYKCFLKDLDRRLEQKLNFGNLIYEISRMQILLQDFIANSGEFSQKRSALKLKLNEKTQLYEIINYSKPKDAHKKAFILDQTIDPFIYSYPLGNENETVIKQVHKNEMMKSDTQFQPDVLIFHENEEIQIENRNIIYSESMRPQQSF